MVIGNRRSEAGGEAPALKDLLGNGTMITGQQFLFHHLHRKSQLRRLIEHGGIRLRGMREQGQASCIVDYPPEKVEIRVWEFPLTRQRAGDEAGGERVVPKHPDVELTRRQSLVVLYHLKGQYKFLHFLDADALHSHLDAVDRASPRVHTTVCQSQQAN